MTRRAWNVEEAERLRSFTMAHDQSDYCEGHHNPCPPWHGENDENMGGAAPCSTWTYHLKGECSSQGAERNIGPPTD